MNESRIEEMWAAITYIEIALTVLAVFMAAVTGLMLLIYFRWGTPITSIEDIMRLTKSHLQVSESIAKSSKREIVEEVAKIREEVVNSANSGVLSSDSIRVQE